MYPVYNSSYAEYQSEGTFQGSKDSLNFKFCENAKFYPFVEVVKMSFKVVDVDYDNYIIAWTCDETEEDSVGKYIVPFSSKFKL